jgi:hypothetical protein
MSTKMNTKLALSGLIALTLLANARAQVTSFTNRVDFLSALTASNYTENFNSASSGVFSGPVNFSGNGFNITANNSIQGNGLYKDLIGSTNVLSLGGPVAAGALTFNFSVNTYAVGGYFFLGDPGFQTGDVTIALTLSNAPPINLTTNVSSFSNAYFGWTTGNNQILSMTVSSTNTAGWASASEMTVGVPEPSTYALLGMAAAGLAGYVLRRRRR